MHALDMCCVVMAMMSQFQLLITATVKAFSVSYIPDVSVQYVSIQDLR